MRIPDAFFPLVNRVMKLLLRSPLHGLMSGNVMVIHFRGRKTGRRRSTPVRYLRESEGVLFCLTGRETGWWPNFIEAAGVRLRLAGQSVSATAQAFPDDEERKIAALWRMLKHFPNDAPYHGIKPRRGHAPTVEQVRQGAARDVLVTFQIQDREK